MARILSSSTKNNARCIGGPQFGSGDLLASFALQTRVVQSPW